jgi:ligand-binding SRPBCC domain-containing protein
MKIFVLEREQWVARRLEEVFAFFSRPENLQQITPPWLHFGMVEAPKVLAVGSLIHYRLRIHGVPIRWTTEITEWNPPHGFVDRELSGPYALWNHEHLFESSNEGTTMRDRVQWALPLGWAGLVAYPMAKRDVEKIFDFRANAMERLFPRPGSLHGDTTT